MAKKIVTIDIVIPNGSAANTALSFKKRLETATNFKKCTGFIIAEATGPGVAYDVQLEPTNGKPLIQSVNSNFIKLQSGVDPDHNMKTVDFDLPSEETYVWITPKALTTQQGVLQAIFEISE